MGKRRGNGSYLGGHTVVGRNWEGFTKGGKPPKRKIWTLEELVKEANRSADRAEKARKQISAKFDALQKLPASTVCHRNTRRSRRGRKRH